jgi:hypothetical protein
MVQFSVETRDIRLFKIPDRLSCQMFTFFIWLHSLSFYMFSYCYVFLLLRIVYYYVTSSFVSLSILIVMYVPFCVLSHCVVLCIVCV